MKSCETPALAALAVFITTFMPCAALAQGQTGELEVMVTGLKRLGGELALAVFDSEEAYETRSRAVSKAFVPISSDPVKWRTSLPLGTAYVVIVYQDLNANRELDTRLLGIPKEPVGVSNDARGRFGPPSFAAASFVMDAESRSIQISLQ